jgi:hypothetical protein
MYDVLYRFLIKYKNLDLPGIGTIALQIQPATAQFVDRSFSPPEYFFILKAGNDSPSGKLFSWMAARFGITETEAVIQFNDFIFDLTRQLKEGKEITWNGVGVFQKEVTGEIKFDSVEKELPWLEKVVAQKVTRNDAQHTMLVGEDEKTSGEMTAFLSRSRLLPPKFNHWWVWPLALILATLIFLGWYFSEHGMSTGSAGNNKKISPAEAPAPHKYLQ